jgi:multimeric flavodoxin WrbA
VKVVAFDGSKQPKGRAGTLAARLVERLRAAGVEAELVRLERVAHTGCYMCGRCGHRTGDITCSSPPEDGLRRAVRKIKAADAVVFATPAYGAHSSPATQEVLLRLEHDRREKGDARLAGKPAAVVVAPWDSGSGAVADGVRGQLLAHGMAVLDVPGADGPGQDAQAAVAALEAALTAALFERVA